MSKIKIKDFGPIREGCVENDGWIDVNKVTVFIGNQGSGKSTVAKAISTLSWLEKSINRGDTDKDKVSFHEFESFFEYQRIHNYFTTNTYIEYFGKKYHILYDTSKEYPIIKEVVGEDYTVPKIMYVPAERNFLSSISDAFNIKGLPENVFTFAEELKKAQKELTGKKLQLPIADIKYEYDDIKDESYVLGKDYKIRLLEASSGLQSFVPLFIVSKNLSSIIPEQQNKDSKVLTVAQAVRLANEIMQVMDDKGLSENEKNSKTKLVKAKYYNKCFLNIVEEPEQNLFPSSQWEMLKSLLDFNNIGEGNKLIITTHSPYVINYLSVAVQAGYLKNKIKTDELRNRLNKIIRINSTVQPKEISFYQLDEKTGIVKKLSDYQGIPSDNNYLNSSLADGNRLFDLLLEIEEEL